MKSSQKLIQLLTGLEEEREKLSEPGAPLDRFKGKARKVVRTWCHFGQNEEEELEICLNLLRIYL
ncbi:hypothetical protein JCM21738_4807 [Mesobacillus boroniphilus JCM 21738]|uniref:Uncharacterized protein n=1 Tax=Mesobacillus boroniphilus JCM 21738 TaxID=1294265 RepID=W4RVU5_9BACI|nr:hypothetical protein JCM21738_4807 [Mesobacillus boroniphilus JCM 21738]